MKNISVFIRNKLLLLFLLLLGLFVHFLLQIYAFLGLPDKAISFFMFSRVLGVFEADLFVEFSEKLAALVFDVLIGLVLCNLFNHIEHLIVHSSLIIVDG